MIRKILIIFALFLSSCSKDGINKKEIICIISGKIPPFSYYENYDLIGFEIDLIKLIGSKLNKKIIFKNIPPNQTIAHLERGYGDIAISNFVITKERQKSFLMAKYHSERMAILFNKKNNKFNDLNDILNSNSEISSLYGMFNKEFLEWSKKNFHSLKIIYFFNEVLTIYAMNNNIVSSVIMTESEAEFLKNSNKDLYDYFIFKDLKFDFGILINKNNKVLFNKINDAISEIKKTGEINDLLAKYKICIN